MDDVLLEVRKVREDYARQFGYDLEAIHRDLKEQERASGRRVVSLPPRRLKRITKGVSNQHAQDPGLPNEKPDR